MRKKITLSFWYATTYIFLLSSESGKIWHLYQVHDDDWLQTEWSHVSYQLPAHKSYIFALQKYYVLIFR